MGLAVGLDESLDCVGLDWKGEHIQILTDSVNGDPFH